jgi:Fe-S cluster assembly iron-binding protein IscA
VLAVTSGATRAIDQILSKPEVPEGAGIRIESAGAGQSSNGAEPQGNAIRMVIAPEPPGGDEILEREGVRLFIEPNVSEFLEDKLLDVATDGVTVEFVLAEQA